MRTAGRDNVDDTAHGGMQTTIELERTDSRENKTEIERSTREAFGKRGTREIDGCIKQVARIAGIAIDKLLRFVIPKHWRGCHGMRPIVCPIILRMKETQL